MTDVVRLYQVLRLTTQNWLLPVFAGLLMRFLNWLLMRAYIILCPTGKVRVGKGCSQQRDTIWLVIFVSTNFRERGQKLGFRNLHSFNFGGW